MEKYVNAMIEKAGKAEKSDDALKFSQAACNAAKAICELAAKRTMSKENAA